MLVSVMEMIVAIKNIIMYTSNSAFLYVTNKQNQRLTYHEK